MRKIRVLLLVWGVISCVGCHRSVTAPPELIGTWRTAAPEFEGRFIRIEAHYIVFGAGEETQPDAEYIEKVLEKKVAGGKVFLIQANDMQKNRNEIEIEYTDGERPQVRLTSRKQVIWTRAG